MKTRGRLVGCTIDGDLESTKSPNKALVKEIARMTRNFIAFVILAFVVAG